MLPCGMAGKTVVPCGVKRTAGAAGQSKAERPSALWKLKGEQHEVSFIFN